MRIIVSGNGGLTTRTTAEVSAEACTFLMEKYNDRLATCFYHNFNLVALNLVFAPRWVQAAVQKNVSKHKGEPFPAAQTCRKGTLLILAAALMCTYGQNADAAEMSDAFRSMGTLSTETTSTAGLHGILGAGCSTERALSR